MSTADFTKSLEKATNGQHLAEPDWAENMAICDYITNKVIEPKEALSAIRKKLVSSDPHVILLALQLLDSCVSNCGKPFHLVVCSREMETEIQRLLNAKQYPKVAEKMKEFLQKWSTDDFAKDPQLSLIPSLYRRLSKEGMRFDKTGDKTQGQSTYRNVMTEAEREQAELNKAIELSLLDSTSPKTKAISSSSALYPSISDSTSRTNQSGTNGVGSFASGGLSSVSNSHVLKTKEPYKVRALYDFEAAEDNEITFKAGEMLVVLDDSDSNWWKGSNQRGEGLFPSNFVTKDLEDQPITVPHKPEGRKSVQFDDEVKVKVFEPEITKIDENKIDRLLYLLHDADPTGEKADSEELLQLEEKCVKMGPLIDQELEKIDKQHAAMISLNRELIDALNLYSSLMKESTLNAPNSGYAYGPVPPSPQQQQQQQQQPQNLYSGYQMQDPNYQMQPPQQQYNPGAYAGYAVHYDQNGQYHADQNAVAYSAEQTNNYGVQPQQQHPQQIQHNPSIPQQSPQPYYSTPTQNPPTM